jgi:hypothetical protein
MQASLQPHTARKVRCLKDKNITHLTGTKRFNTINWAGTFEQSMRARKRVGIGLSYQPAEAT